MLTVSALFPSSGMADSTMVVSSSDGLNLRSGPGLGSGIITVIPFGATVTITGDPVEGNWLPATFNGVSGYVLGEFMTARPAPGPVSLPGPGSASVAFSPPQPGTPPQPAVLPPAPPIPVPLPLPVAPGQSQQQQSSPQYAAVAPPDGLNLRTGPATNFPVLIAAPGGARVQIVGRATSDGWYSVVYNGKTGWVDGKYLTFGVAAPGPALGVAPTASSATSSMTPLPVPADTKFMWPVESRRISTLYSGGHPGIDIDEYPSGGNPVVATASGTVSFAGGTTCCSYGLYVIVKHADGYNSLYSHLSMISVSEGQELKQGQVLGKSGNTGFSTGAHLHFEIRKDGVSVNPLSLLSGPYNVE